MNKTDLVPPQKDGRDVIHSLVASANSAIPVAGLLMNEFYKAIILPAFDQRVEDWREAVSAALIGLLDNKNVEIDSLINNEEFKTILIKASFAAWQDHQEEKRQALRNAVLNAALGIEIEHDFQQVFIRWIDELTVTHVQVLQYLYSNMEKLVQMKSYEGIRVEFHKDTGSTIKFNEISLLIQDLDRRDLIEISNDLDDYRKLRKKPKEYKPVITQEDQQKPKMDTTRMGLDFLQFITNPLEESEASNDSSRH